MLLIRKTVLYIAVSLDGYIADKNGGVGWLEGENSTHPSDYGYARFLSETDTVIMGYTTYKQIVTELSPDKWPYTTLTSFVLTTKNPENKEGITFINRPAAELLHSLKQSAGKNIWICGGVQTVYPLIQENLIDEYHISTIPLLLGNGIHLFESFEKRIPLKLLSSTAENGVVSSVYGRRHP